MLILTRKPKQKIEIGGNITVTILRATRRLVRLGIDAPDGIRVIRTEISRSIEARKDRVGCGCINGN
jgi:carbon storage regulator